MLTNVAYKITVADSLPKLGYNTYLDYYTLVNFSFLVFLSIENLIVGRHHEDDWSEETDEWCLFALLVVYVLISVGFIGRAVYIVHKDPLQLQTLKTRDIG